VEHFCQQFQKIKPNLAEIKIALQKLVAATDIMQNTLLKPLLAYVPEWFANSIATNTDKCTRSNKQN